VVSANSAALLSSLTFVLSVPSWQGVVTFQTSQFAWLDFR